MSIQKETETSRTPSSAESVKLSELQGLTSEEVAQKIANGEGGAPLPSVTKTTLQIIKDNVCTLFNLLNFLIAGLLFYVHAYSNMAFIAIICLNICIGIIQELKAKKLVDELTILNQPRATVLRDGKAIEISSDQIVRDDVMILESGRQICNDAIVLSRNIEVNESLLTGESDAVIHPAGSKLLSGSFVISGKCLAKVIHVGEENYSSSLAAEVKQEKQTCSELLGSMQKVTHFTSRFLVPIGVALLAESYFLQHASIETAVVSSSAGLLGMLPKGLVLLISVSLATGVSRLAKKHILVQNLFALETLAHVDVLCLDKTGTITSGNLSVSEIFPLSSDQISSERSEKLINAYLGATDDNNATALALKAKFHPSLSGKIAGKIPFSSIRKWGAVSFEGVGTVFVGAPERLLQETLPAEKLALEAGKRVLAAAFCPEIWSDNSALPAFNHLTPLYLFTLTDTIRPNTKETLDYFAKQGVDVKIISGDHVKTVSQTARRAGLKRWKDAIDLSTIDENTADYHKLCNDYAVFARVTPRQKQRLVATMQEDGHKVAMTGDGVNDLLALHQADCSIAVAQGSDASRQLAQIVLMESDFTHLPQVVKEGRRVIHNVTRTAGVFFIKTIYSLLLSVFCLAVNIPFPFIPIQITLVDAFIEAFPSFATIFESDTSPVSGHFLPTAFRHAAPFAFIITSTILFSQFFTFFSDEKLHTVQYLLLIFFSLAAVLKSCIPFTPLRGAVCILSAIGVITALFVIPGTLHLAPLTLSMVLLFIIIAIMGSVLLILILKIQQAVNAASRSADSQIS
ncbi:HAD-IC family P-type ATPase [Brotaphodocola sp.]|uniref:HAD-IC family P-type ATPase n=1 Tax=Brotaphodocola sp. TaxID=3073577 RepID=UPI003D7CEA53